ncbi:MAG TPA: SH3 domain-containing protein, partial [Candidatus Limnocylindria bacterium]|nr:SH3 domain-containing protein [Candidatus Limnocylindria bacterium]
VRLNAPGSGATPAPTPPGTGAGMMGYIITTKGGINLRALPGGGTVGVVDKGVVLPLTGTIQTQGGYNWFPVVSGNRPGFLRSDCVRQLTQAEVMAYLTNGTIPSISAPAGDNTPPTLGYVLTVMTSVYVRKSPSQDAAVLGQIAQAGEAFEFRGAATSGGKLWFKIVYNGQEGYLLSSTARLMTPQEYTAYVASRPTPTPVPVTPTPRPEDMSNTAVTRMEKVLVRAAASGTAKALTTLYKAGTVARLTGQTEAAGGYTWYRATAGGTTGWIRGDMLRVLTKTEEQMLNDAGDPDAPPPASYRTLELGSTGEDVTRLQQELSRLGYLQAAYVTGTYNSQTVDAVKAYQKDKGLFVDGIAGPATQHKLYNTVPEDTYNPGGGGSTVTPTIYPVELVDWYTGDINAFWGRGQIAIMTDVRTGVSLRIKRWAGGSHVDGEPATAADTAALCRVYGVKSSQEILEKNLYGRRPVWITIKGRTFAASLYGVPHNYPEGDSVAGNDFNGQLCIHFLNSRVHSSGAVDAGHMKAIQDAYNAAPSRK